ncbi:MAG: thiamine-phosphate kinase [Thermofilaceae archaeon]|nr:thiamine-phosphate kinase [Thermofilaceae archaeon]MCX8180457.1 thiamine-phosphate kinase [Thermofilaceae archaeon]MDW8003346.1 thiamine-phosphate kinase [Thermofilaceae archaeon]
MDERELIERAWRVFKRDPRELLGLDDAQAAQLSGNIVFKIDVFDEVTDWLPGMTLQDAGWRAVTAAVSDVLVKGAKPVGVLLGLGLPEETVEVADTLFKGVEEACEALGVRVWGGDTGYSDHLYLAVAALGVAEKLVARSGAKPGDVLMMAGHEILTPAAYSVLLKGAELCEGLEEAVEITYRPKIVPRDFWLSVVDFVTASIDDSDGVALTLHYLAEASGVRLELENLPLSPLLVKCAEAWGEDPLELALYRGGEEYSFIFTVPEEKTSLVLTEAGKHRVRVWSIGRVVEGSGVYLKDYGEVKREGWSFGGWKKVQDERI